MATDLERRFSRLSDPKQSVLTLAAKIGDWSTIYEVLDSRPDLVNFIPENRSHGLLHRAILSENETAVVKILSIEGCDPNLIDRDGMTANELTDNERLKEILAAAQGSSPVRNEQEYRDNFEASSVGDEEQCLPKTTVDLVPKESIEETQTDIQTETLTPNHEIEGNPSEDLEANTIVDDANVVSTNNPINNLNSNEIIEPLNEIIVLEETNLENQVVVKRLEEFQDSDADRMNINSTISNELSDKQLSEETDAKEIVEIRDRLIETPEETCPIDGESVQEPQGTDSHETDILSPIGAQGQSPDKLPDELHSRDSAESPDEVRSKNVQEQKHQDMRETFEELQNRDAVKISEISLAIENSQLVEMAKIIDTDQHLVNVVPPEIGLGPLHQAAIMGDVDTVTKLLSYPASDPDIKTIAAQYNIHGPGKTAEELTTSQEIKEAIIYKRQQLTQEYYTCPTYVNIADSNHILLSYASPTIEAHRGLLCSDRFDSESFDVFPKMVEDVFLHTHYSSKWEQAQELICKDLNSFDTMLAKQIMDNDKKSRDTLYQLLINTYASKAVVNWNLNNEMKKQLIRDSESSLKFCSYTVLLNGILFVWDQLESYTKATYRGMNLDVKELNDYSVGIEFAWLNFVSSSSDRKVAQRFVTNKDKFKCLFIFDNKRQCKWSPRSIEKISNHEREKEYLYPCGAQFKVIKVETVSEFRHIYLELICVVDSTPLRSLFEETVARTEKNIQTIKEEAEQFDRDLTQLKEFIEVSKDKDTQANKDQREQLNKSMENAKLSLNSLLNGINEDISILEFALTTQTQGSTTPLPRKRSRIFFQDKPKDKQKQFQQLKDTVIELNASVRNAITTFSEASELTK